MKDDPLSSGNPRRVIFVRTSVRIFCVDSGRLFICCQNPLGGGKKSESQWKYLDGKLNVKHDRTTRAAC